MFKAYGQRADMSPGISILEAVASGAAPRVRTGVAVRRDTAVATCIILIVLAGVTAVHAQTLSEVSQPEATPPVDSFLEPPASGSLMVDGLRSCEPSMFSTMTREGVSSDYTMMIPCNGDEH